MQLEQKSLYYLIFQLKTFPLFSLGGREGITMSRARKLLIRISRKECKILAESEILQNFIASNRDAFRTKEPDGWIELLCRLDNRLIESFFVMTRVEKNG